MIQNLSLPTTFPAWSWEKSNGIASDSQTQSSYLVLVDQGKCSDFSRLVWNDIVDTLANVLTEMGLEWDSKYCTVEECKINVHLGILMAFAWNSVAWNIKRFGFVMWKWARSTNTPGCIGREAVNGYSTHGEDADNLFAWYLVEMTEKLNRLIEVLKGEADFSNFEHIQQSTAPVLARLTAPKIEPITGSGAGESITAANLGKARVLEYQGIGTGYSYQNGVLVPMPPFSFLGHGKGETLVWTDLELYGTSGIDGNGLAESHVATLLAVSDSKALFAAASYMLSQAHTQLFAAVSAILQAGVQSSSRQASDVITRLPALQSSVLRSKSMHVSPLIRCHSLPMSRTLFAETVHIAPAVADHSAPGAAIIPANSNSTQDAKAVQAVYMSKQDQSESHVNSEAFSGMVKYFENESQSESRHVGTVVPRDSKRLFSVVKGASASLAESEKAQSSAIVALQKAKSAIVAALSFYVPTIEWTDPVQTGSNLYIKSVYALNGEGTNVHLGLIFIDAVQTGSNVHIKSAYADNQYDENMHLGLVYHEPVQEGTNVYIRSAESVKGV